MDLLTLLIWVAFYVLFAASIRQFLRRRGSLELAVVLVFASSAGIFLVSAVSGVVPSLVPLLSPVAVTLLIAQPALMLRLVSLFVPLRPWALPAATAGFVVSLGLFYGTSRSVASILLVVAYFVGTETIAAVALMRESRRRHGFARARLATAAAASLLFGITILVSGVASAARGGAAGQDPAVTLVARSLGLLAGLGYLFAFVPPAWLRSLGHRALAYDLVRRIVSAPAGAQTRMLWESFAGSAADVLGASSVRVLVGGAVIAYDNATAPRSDARQALEVPIELDGRTVANLVADVSGRPLFIEDDIALVQLLGSLTARSAERDLAIAAVADAARATADAEAVLQSESRFRALLDAEPNAVLVTDRSGSITWSTAAAAAMFGVPSDDLVGRRLDELVAPPVATSPATADRAGTTRYETTAATAGGGTLPVEVAITVLAADGQETRLVVVADNSWRHEAYAIRDRFIGVLSHELRTPITAIFGGTQILLKRPNLDPAARAEMLADVAGEAERLQRMVENLLVLARAEADAELADIGPILVHRSLVDVIDRERAIHPGLAIEAQLPASLPVVAGDEASIALVLRNLVSNAAKYAGDEARVTISADATADGGVRVSVTDDGPGFDPADADNLFHLYFRAGATSSAPGSGIGLFVSDQLVRAMGGRMSADVAPGGGSTFAFTLPAYVDADEEAVAAEPLALATAAPDEPDTVRAAAVSIPATPHDRQRAAFSKVPGIG